MWVEPKENWVLVSLGMNLAKAHGCCDIPKIPLFFLNKYFKIFSFVVYLDILSGDTFTDGSVRYTMTSMNVPEPVMSLAVSPVSKDSGGQVIGS